MVTLLVAVVVVDGVIKAVVLIPVIGDAVSVGNAAVDSAAVGNGVVVSVVAAAVVLNFEKKRIDVPVILFQSPPPSLSTESGGKA